MAYRTVNVKPGTYRRLAAYRALGLTFDDVVTQLMDRVPVKSMHGDLVRKAARDLQVPGAAEDVVLEFDEVPAARARAAGPGATSATGAGAKPLPRPPTRSPPAAQAKGR